MNEGGEREADMQQKAPQTTEASLDLLELHALSAAFQKSVEDRLSA